MGLRRTLFKSALCLVISQVFCKVYLSIYRVYLDSVTIASYSILLIGLCHKKVVINLEVWCYPYPTDYQHVTQIAFTFGGPHVFFIIYSKCFTFFIYNINILLHFT